jgi:hypothetical protein
MPKGLMGDHLPNLLSCLSTSFQNFENGLVGGFYLPVRLRMSGRRKLIPYVKLGTPLLE